MSKKVVIGITDCEKYSNYEKWMLTESDVDVIRLGHKFSNLERVKKCDGILFTGGTDIHPRFYGNLETHYSFAPKKFEEQRDEFERTVFNSAHENNIPILGICRGMQLINCILSGTLKQDLGELNKTHKGGPDKIHSTNILKETLLYKNTDVTIGEVNSSHHQAIDKLGLGLRINCKADDGTIEGIELSGTDHPFLLAVQWHPERMNDQESPLAKNIRKSFIEHCLK